MRCLKFAERNPFSVCWCVVSGSGLLKRETEFPTLMIFLEFTVFPKLFQRSVLKAQHQYHLDLLGMLMSRPARGLLSQKLGKQNPAPSTCALSSPGALQSLRIAAVMYNPNNALSLACPASAVSQRSLPCA